MPDLVLAVDQGSSSSRCVALNSDLEPVAIASRPLAAAFPGVGRVEHDAGALLDGVRAVLAEALAMAGSGWDDVAGIGLAAQTETFVVWDRASGEPVHPAISWRDSRAAALCADLRRGGHEPAIVARTGLPLQPAFSAAKLAWLLDEVPGARRAAASGRLLFGDVNCWLTWRLSGGAVHATEPSMAARTMLFNLATGTWDPVMLDLFGVPEQMLPVIVPTTGPVACTDAAACGGQATIFASIGDQQAALFGQRCWREGMAKLSLGTGAFLWCNAGTALPPAAPAGVVASCAWQLAGQTTYALEGFVPNAGGITTWLRGLGVLGAGAWPLIRPGAVAATAGPWCVPAIFGLGTPHWAAGASALLGGLTAGSTGQDVAEAALLGVVHQIVDAIDAVRHGLPSPLLVLRADGGLSRNDSVLAAIADLSGVELERPAVTELSAWGAGALAAIGGGRYDLAALAGLPFASGRRVRPELPAAARADARAAWQAVLGSWLAAGQPGSGGQPGPCGGTATDQTAGQRGGRP